jgi:outer membrane protein assembly factor BamB
MPPRRATSLPSRRPGRTALVAALALAVLAGCNNREPPLPGERLEIRPEAEPEAGAAARALALPPPQVNASWSHRNGAVNGRLVHPALSAQPQPVWSVDIGAGNATRRRILTAPIVAGGLIFTMDAEGIVSAVTPQGAIAWQRSIVPEGQLADNGPGGGLAEAGGVLFVTTGFGEVLALDPASGAIRWRETLEGPVRAAPAVLGGRVFAVVRNDTAVALDAGTGALLWRAQGSGGVGVLGGATPAADGALVVVPFASGEVLGVLARNGLQVWGTAVTGGRRELVRNRINDITGDPVIDGTVVYASNQSGRTVSIDRNTGERNWTMPEGSFGPAWPVGGSLFLLSDRGALVRADAATGAILWSVQLEEYFKENRAEAIVHHGPVLAGGRLWVASSDGLLRAFAPVDGTLLGTVAIPGGAAAPPAVARGVMYVVTGDGRLHAFQ